MGDGQSTLEQLHRYCSSCKVRVTSYVFGKVRLVTDKESNKPSGYVFIEYMHTRDMKAAYKQADGKKLDNRRVLVDVERGKTVPNWRPRRLGGGLGTIRVGREDVNQKYSGR
ncbi:U1 small nuclear ribonucleoprotein 70 kDa [Camellia lanceoleosa]|uniref:U1 small nuclear ribonucleoprotein 70 kDa n=1 Tax=Camellia lanceoleosa TaxID=1840588 RepID=A0ACC0FBH5_9ERIC|nr:U1 small nuclear ribonucleoprotein 70 kDa [Camellia lanceoleosa]